MVVPVVLLVLLDLLTATPQQAHARGEYVVPPMHLARSDKGLAVRAAIQAAPHRLKGELDVGGQEQFYLEGQISYAIPKEGAPQWFDMLAIPKDAKHVDEAYAFINYLLDPQVMANNSNFISYPNAIPKAKELMDKAITGDPTIYPTPEVEAKLFTFAIIPPEVDRQYTRIWTELKTGK